MKEAKWFKDFKTRVNEFYNIENAIESLKIQHKKSNHLIEWVIGISLAILFSLNIFDVINSETRWIAITSIIAYVLCLLFIFISLTLYILTNSRQNQIIRHLYREKDKKERKAKRK